MASSITVKHFSTNRNTFVEAAPLGATTNLLVVPCAGALDFDRCVLQYLVALVSRETLC